MTLGMTCLVSCLRQAPVDSPPSRAAELGTIRFPHIVSDHPVRGLLQLGSRSHCKQPAGELRGALWKQQQGLELRPRSFVFLLLIQEPRLGKIRAYLLGSSEGLFPAPAVNRAVVAAEEDVRHGNVAKYGGAGVLRVLQKAGSMGLVASRLGVYDAGDEAGDSINYHHRRDLAAAEDVVAYGELARREMLADSVVNAFIATADEREARQVSKFLGYALAEGLARRTKQNDRGVSPFLRRRADNLLNGTEYRLGLHHHACAATVGGVVCGAMLVGRPVTNVVQLDSEQAARDRPLDDALRKRPGEHSGEDCKDVEAQIRTSM